MLDQNSLNSKSALKPQLQLSLKLNYQELAAQILRQMRGSLTQRQLSEKLGYSFNQVGKWESGVTQVKWDDFLLLCGALGIPMDQYFRYSFWSGEPEFNTLSTLRALEVNFSLSSLQDPSMRASVKKWLNGTLVPDFAEVLKAMGTKSPMMFGWLSLFVDCKKLSILNDLYEDFLLNLDSVLSDPIIVYVNAALQLKRYQDLESHDEALLAEHSACSMEQLRIALQTLCSHGLIRYDGKKYYPGPFDFSFGGLRHPKLRGLTKYTTCLAAQRYPETPIFLDPQRILNPSRSSVRVAALSSDAAQKIVDLICQFHNDVGDIVNQDRLPKDNVQVILVHGFVSNINAEPTDSIRKNDSIQTLR